MIYIPQKKRLLRYGLLALFIFCLLRLFAPKAPDTGEALPAIGPITRPGAAQPVSADILLARLPEAQREYYYTIFEYTMEHKKPGDASTWQGYALAGAIEAGEAFTSGDTVCRRFREQLTSREYTRIYGEGTACRRVGDDGWCRLHPDNANTCAMEPPANEWERSLRGGQEFLDDSEYRWRNFRRNWLPF